MSFDWPHFIIASASFLALWAGADLFLKSSLGMRLRTWWYQRSSSRFECRLQARLRAGEDRYFEELRSIESNAPCKPSLDEAALEDWRRAVALSLLLGFMQAFDVTSTYQP
jgi:hypothetical protein